MNVDWQSYLDGSLEGEELRQAESLLAEDARAQAEFEASSGFEARSARLPSRKRSPSNR